MGGILHGVLDPGPLLLERGTDVICIQGVRASVPQKRLMAGSVLLRVPWSQRLTRKGPCSLQGHLDGDLLANARSFDSRSRRPQGPEAKLGTGPHRCPRHQCSQSGCQSRGSEPDHRSRFRCGSSLAAAAARRASSLPHRRPSQPGTTCIRPGPRPLARRSNRSSRCTAL